MIKRKICAVTGSRAEYGLLKPVLTEIKSDQDLQLQIIATGQHMSDEFGLTYKDIERDGFLIDEKIECLVNSDTPAGISRSMGLTMISLAEAYVRLQPDIVLVLGDRFEIFSAVAPAHIARIPVAHIHGGEVTAGAFDDALRHSITKMSQLHFTATEEYRKRVIQLGESPDRVFNVGATGLDNIMRGPLLPREELEKEMNFKLNKHNLLVTYHPVTLEHNTAREQFQRLLTVLDDLKDTHLIFTGANADTDGRVINQMIESYVSQNRQKSISFKSLGQVRYLSAMQYMDAVIGNSSSGIIEAPSFKIGTINIGDRQKGRVNVHSIIDCEPREEDIVQAIRKLYSPKFQADLKDVVNPHGDGHAGPRIKQILKDSVFEDIKKGFFEIDFSLPSLPPGAEVAASSAGK